jgi:hypothetical protein
MAQQGNSGSSVNVVAIIAILVLVALAAWFFIGQRSRQTPPPPTSNAPSSGEKADIKVEVDLPDTVTIKP